MIAKNTEGQIRKRVTWFFVGATIIITGIFLNLLSGILASIWMEMLVLIAFDIGLIAIVKGFLVK